MNKIYFCTIPALLFLFLAALPGAYGQTTDPKCAFVNDTGDIYPSAAFFNYGSGTNIRNTSRTMDITIGQMVVDAAWDDKSVFTSEFGYWGQFLVPPQAPMVTATQGQLLDRIQIKWALEPLGSSASGGFNLYRDSIFLTTVANNIRTYNDFFVIAGTPYNYEVRGVNIYGEGIGGKAIGFQVPNGTVTGWVQTLNGTPVPDAFVALTPVQGYSVRFGPGGGAFAESNPGIKDALLPPDGGEWTLAFWVKTESAGDSAGIIGLETFPFLLRPIKSGLHEGIEVAQTDGSPALLRAQFPDSTKND